MTGVKEWRLLSHLVRRPLSPREGPRNLQHTGTEGRVLSVQHQRGWGVWG